MCSLLYAPVNVNIKIILTALLESINNYECSIREYFTAKAMSIPNSNLAWLLYQFVWIHTFDFAVTEYSPLVNVQLVIVIQSARIIVYHMCHGG